MSVVLDYTGGVFAAKPTGGSVGSISGNATVDLSSGNTFVHAPSANVTYAFANPPASGTAIDFTLKVTGAGAYDIANASYDSVSFSVAAKETLPAGLSFKSDGTKMYVCGNNSDAVHEYNLTAWDISTASFNQSFSLTQAGTHSADLFFKPDGLSFFIAEQNNADIDEYTMTSAWDISTASFNQSFSVSGQETAPRGLFFKPDGTKMYVCGNTGDDVNEYSLTAWDISTASYVQNVSVSAKDTIPQGVVFNSSGKSFFIAGNSSDSIHEFSMTTSWDVSTASFANTLSVSGQDTAPTALFFKPDGTKLFVSGGANDTVFQYSTVAATPSTIAWPSSVKWAGGTAPSAPASGETDAFTFYSTDNGTSYYGFHAGDAYS